MGSTSGLAGIIMHTLPVARILKSKGSGTVRQHLDGNIITKCISVANAHVLSERSCVRDYGRAKGLGVMGFSHGRHDRGRLGDGSSLSMRGSFDSRTYL
jgi:hypothetical protein